MTKRIYYNSPYQIELKTTVTECRKRADGLFNVLTAETIVFPAGGGQPYDIGKMNNASIVAAEDMGDDVFHIVDAIFDPGETVTITIDWNRRFDHSQQHTGEHMVSGIAHSLFSVKNVGFHMGTDYVTIDFDKMLTKEQINELEMAVNRAILMDIPVRSRIISMEELSTISLRKKADGISGAIRIVDIEGIDSCTCCGTHTLTTGGVGLLKITDSMKHRGGIRLWMTCGMRALVDYSGKHDTLIRLGKHFSTRWQNLEAAILSQEKELADMRFEAKRRQLRYCELRAKELLSNTSGQFIAAIESDSEIEEIKLLCDRIIQEEDKIALLFGTKSDTIYYCIARGSEVDISMKTLCLAVNAALSGKGGGRDDIAQGSAKIDPCLPTPDLNMVIANIRNIIHK